MQRIITFTFLVLLVGIIVFATGCGSTSGNETASGNRLYFNLQSFFQSEIDRLTTQKIALQKTVALNGETETLQLPDVDWSKELWLFMMSDINKPAWTGKYTADTLQQTGKTQITYAANDPALRTQKITLLFEGNATTPAAVSITNSVENFIYQLSENLTYQTQHGYEINTTQKVTLMKQQQYNLKAVFTNL